MKKEPARSASPPPALVKKPQVRLLQPTPPQNWPNTLFASLQTSTFLKEAYSGFAIQDEKPDEQSGTHHGKSQVDMPSMQLRRRHNRPECRQRQQKGSLALRDFFLFDHSRSTCSPWRPLCTQAKRFPRPQVLANSRLR